MYGVTRRGKPVTKYPPIDSFCNLPPKFQASLHAAGYSSPAPIQQVALPALLARQDVLVQASSGSGKTITFLIGTLTRVVPAKKSLQVVILAPTRELVAQIAAVASTVSAQVGMQVVGLMGGRKVAADVAKLSGCTPHVLVGTPGRVRDLLRRGAIKPKHVTTFVLDEVDHMLQKGFAEQVFAVYRELPASIQTVLVSATMTPEVQELKRHLTVDPVEILMKTEDVPVQTIQQYLVDVGKEEWKFDALCDLYDRLVVAQAVIFCNARRKVEWLAKQMRQSHFTVAAVHGDMKQTERESVMATFRGGENRVLIATDLWARGIDVSQVSLVINYDVPISNENYIHRIGRVVDSAGRVFAITLVAGKDDKKRIRELERGYSVKIAPLPKDISSLL